MIYFGYDPGGGASKSGVAVFSVKDGVRRCETDSVSSVDEAMHWFIKWLRGDRPVAAGIAALLFWETSRCGWRGVDQWLKQSYGSVMRSVVSPNSAQGSMAIQGMGLGIRLRQSWPEIQLTETHPKVLYFALSGQRYDWPSTMMPWLGRTVNASEGGPIRSQHEWNALFSAWVAQMGHTGAWTTDLRRRSDRALEPAGPVSYWWPASGGEGAVPLRGRDVDRSPDLWTVS